MKQNLPNGDAGSVLNGKCQGKYGRFQWNSIYKMLMKPLKKTVLVKYRSRIQIDTMLYLNYDDDIGVLGRAEHYLVKLKRLVDKIQNR